MRATPQLGDEYEVVVTKKGDIDNVALRIELLPGCEAEIDAMWEKPLISQLICEVRSNQAMTSSNITDMNIREMVEKISLTKQEVNAIKSMSGGIQAVDKNIDRILASIRMLEINICDLLEVL